MYHVGDCVVRSADGLCRIKDVVRLDFVSDREKLYYQLESFSDQNGKIYVPVDKAEGSMRPAMSGTQAKMLIKQIPAIKEGWVANEKERQSRYKEAIQSNDPKRLIGIIKLIYQRKKMRQAQGKKTTAVDEQYFAVAESRLYSELQYALNTTRSDVEMMIRQSCEKDRLPG